MKSQPNIPKVRTITLPSGHKVELINFAEPPAPEGVSSSSVQVPLNVCRACGSTLVQPISWLQQGARRWNMTLRCPECEHVESGNFSETQIELLEDSIDEALAQIIEDLQRLARSNMVEDVERFTAALRSDLILPEDF